MSSARVIDKYELIEKLGEGGFGVVYKARHTLTRLPVAIKILLAQADHNPEVVLRFRREAFIGNQIDHDNIVRAFDFGEHAGQPYLVLELLDGCSLAETVRAQGPLALERAFAILLQVARALAATHAHHVIHRDLKPENIFLLRRDGQSDFVKVLDFGIAKLTAEAPDALKTRSLALIGSPVTMSPEQCRGAAIDHRSDIYALGVVAFFVLSGRYPFHGAQADVLSAHLRDPPPRLSRVRPALPVWLDDFVTRALAKRPEDRFQSMDELARTLVGLRERTAELGLGRTPSLRPPPPRRRRRRAWLALPLLGAGVAACLLGLSGLGRRHNGDIAAAALTPMPEAEATRPTTLAGRGGESATVVDDLAGDGATATMAPARPAVLRVAALRPAPRRSGYLTVAVLPFADVVVDGRALGSTPLRRLALPPGPHTIELSNTGLHRVARRTALIAAGAHQRIQLDWSN